MPDQTAPRQVAPSATGSAELLARARAGDERAVSVLFKRYAGTLYRWARGRLPRWAHGTNDTADMVQDALLNSFRRLDGFEVRGRGALHAYLRQAVENRIRDEIRRIGRRSTEAIGDEVLNLRSTEPSPYDVTDAAESEHRYKIALTKLSDEERVLVVGRLELGYTYEQLAVVANRPTSEAARLAVRRAVTKLAHHMASD